MRPHTGVEKTSLGSPATEARTEGITGVASTSPARLRRRHIARLSTLRPGLAPLPHDFSGDCWLRTQPRQVARLQSHNELLVCAESPDEIPCRLTAERIVARLVARSEDLSAVHLELGHYVQHLPDCETGMAAQRDEALPAVVVEAPVPAN